MPTIALLAASGRLLGFLLIAGSGGLDEIGPEADCVFTGVPSEASLLSHELSSFVQERKHIEVPCAIQRSGSVFLVDVQLDLDPRVQLTVPPSGYGKWQVIQGEQRSIEAACELLPTAVDRVAWNRRGADFVAEVSFLSREVGGRQSPPRQGYKCDVQYDGYPEDGPSLVWMIWPRFLSADGNELADGTIVPEKCVANFYIVDPKLRESVHSKRLGPGVQFRMVEGLRTVALCTVKAIL